MAEPGTDMEAAEAQRLEQAQAAQRDRQAALRMAAEEAGAYKAGLLENGFDDVEAVRLVEQLMTWYWEGSPPCPS